MNKKNIISKVIKKLASIKHGWWIHTSYIEEEMDKAKKVDVKGPRGMPNFTDKEFEEKGIPFKLFDDDKNLYYEGFVIVDPEDEETILSPLDDYGTPNAGCTIMQAKEKGIWKNIN